MIDNWLCYVQLGFVPWFADPVPLALFLLGSLALIYRL